ncbi:hypothetical protein RB195_011337 [Necator americanus]|uniref:EB module n=1 Tax=Necator americanus TaxID=51031 RepID=A0ABR1D232_NECAM
MWKWFVAVLLLPYAKETYVTNIRKRVEMKRVRYQRGFKFEDFCKVGIAMYTTSRGYWKCKNQSECPSGYSCTNSGSFSVCCPTEDLCPTGCPVSNETGIRLCQESYDCSQETVCTSHDHSIGVCCMSEIMCAFGLPQIESFNPYPVIQNCVLSQDCNIGYVCVARYEDKEGYCCPEREQNYMTSKQMEHFKELYQKNEEKIARRKSLKRDITYMIPVVGTPLLGIIILCCFHMRNELQRSEEQRRINAFIARKKKRVQKMPSAEIKKGEFKYQGVLKMSAKIGEIKHALDDESSRSLSEIGFDIKYNEVVVIGSEVESIEEVHESVNDELSMSKRSTVGAGIKERKRRSKSHENQGINKPQTTLIRVRNSLTRKKRSSGSKKISPTRSRLKSLRTKEKNTNSSTNGSTTNESTKSITGVKPEEMSGSLNNEDTSKTTKTSNSQSESRRIHQADCNKSAQPSSLTPRGISSTSPSRSTTLHPTIASEHNFRRKAKQYVGKMVNPGVLNTDLFGDGGMTESLPGDSDMGRSQRSSRLSRNKPTSETDRLSSMVRRRYSNV